MRRKHLGFSGTLAGFAALLAVPETTLKSILMWSAFAFGLPAATTVWVSVVLQARAQALANMTATRDGFTSLTSRGGGIDQVTLQAVMSALLQERCRTIQRFIKSANPEERARVKAMAKRLLVADEQLIDLARRSGPPRGSFAFDQTQAMIAAFGRIDSMLTRIEIEPDPIINDTEMDELLKAAEI